MSQNVRYLEKSDIKLASLIIFGALGFTLFAVLAICGLFVLCNRGATANTGRRRSNNSIVREQSISIVRGDHPIAFMLPTVSHSEAGSETDPTPSDLESFGYQSSHGPSPALSLASLTGGNLYSSTLLSPQPLRAYPGGSAHLQRLSSPRPLSTPSNTSPRLGISTGKRVQAPRPVSLPSFPLQIPSGGSSPLPSLYGKDQNPGYEAREENEDDDEDGERMDGGRRKINVFGRIYLRITFRNSVGELQIKILKGEDLPANYRTRSANVSVKISIIPSKLPKYCTEIVSDSVNPDFNQEFIFLLSAHHLHGKVLRLTVLEHEKSNKKVIGSAVLSLSGLGFTADIELQVREERLDLKESVEAELTQLLADRLQVSLRYEPEPGRLTLGVMTARILSIPVQDRDADVYVKVTLFEGKRVIKAKKTRLINISEEVCFNERFSILLPSTFLDGVSCVVSLCSRSALGVKQVLGRSSVGPYAFCSGLGLEQWQSMIENPGEEINRLHLVL